MGIVIHFACGHQIAASGAEDGLRCQCGESTVERVEAPPPRFVGHCTGPHAVYQELEPKPVEFKKEDSHG